MANTTSHPATPQQPPPKPPAPKPEDPQAPAKPGVDQGMIEERKAVEAALEPKDFKLAKPGSKDYVAGQPVDDAELKEVTAEAKKRIAAGQNPKDAGGTVHMRTVQQYGPEGQEKV